MSSGRLDSSARENTVILADSEYIHRLSFDFDEEDEVIDYYHTGKVIEEYGVFLSEKLTDARFHFLKV